MTVLRQAQRDTGGWIPPLPLALGAFIGAASWLLVIVYGMFPSFGIELAWIHAVALGSFTTIALSVLIHVLPGFTDLAWRGEGVARWSGRLLPFAALGFIVSFAMNSGTGVAIFGGVSALLVLAFAMAAMSTLMQEAPTATERAIARAFLGVFMFLAIAAVFGAALAGSYASGALEAFHIAGAHASIAIVGWLTLLTMGVSARTFRPILGSDPRWRAMHIASNSAMLLAAVLIPVSFGLDIPIVTHAAFTVALVAALAYGIDGLDRVARAQTPNRAAHAFVVAALLWLVVAAIAGAFGAYALAVVAALAGWIGQMINAHLHHIGIRVIATTVAGDDDETRPWQLVDARLSWTTMVLAQVAVLALLAGVVQYEPWLFFLSGGAGLAAAAAFACNVNIAIRRA